MKTAQTLSKFILDNSIKGFLAEDEACYLMSLVEQHYPLGAVLEIGSYCGKSTVYIGEACKALGATLFSVDHHRGSEEHQYGEAYHDTQLYDEQLSKMDSLPAFRRTLHLADLDSTVIPIIATSSNLAPHWTTPLSLVFVDGGHSYEAALHDCTVWSKKLVKGGVLAVHDLFELPEDGGQAPFDAFNAVYNEGGWEKLSQVNSLGALRKL